jgi:uncharacterized RDD family membrane protein YckC
MASALDEVLENKQAQEFWLRRLIAIIIDAVIIFIPITVMTSIAWAAGVLFQPTWILSGALLVAYSALFESELGYTIGKRLMGLEVVSLDPRPYDMKRALIRNITKVHGVFLLIDMLLGIMAEDRTNMRYLDTVVVAEVVDQQVADWRRAHGLAPPPGDGEAPPVTVDSDAAPPEPTMPPEPAEPEPPEAPEVPDEDALEEVADEGTGAPGIAPPPIPEEGVTVEEELEEELEEVPREEAVEAPEEELEELDELSIDEIMEGGSDEAEPAYRMPKPDKGGE